MSTKGSKLAETGREQIDRRQYAQAIGTLGAAVKQLLADGETHILSATIRKLAEAQLAMKQYDAAWQNLEAAVQFTPLADRGELMMDRARVLDAAASPEAANAWRLAVQYLPKSLTTLSCLSRAAGCDLRHGRDAEALAAARALADEYTTPLQHVAIASDIAISAVERSAPFLAQAMRIMLYDRRALVARGIQLAIEQASPDMRPAVCHIGGLADLNGMSPALLPQDLQSVLMNLHIVLEKDMGLARLARQLGELRGSTVTLVQVPLDYWRYLPAAQGYVMRLDALYVSMIPNEWLVIDQPVDDPIDAELTALA